MASCGSSKKPSFADNSMSISDIKYEGGLGTSIEDAVIIKGAKSSFDGIPSEYIYLESRHGKRGLQWKMLSQSLVHEGKKSYDILKIVKQRDTMDVYFDITAFYGKF